MLERSAMPAGTVSATISAEYIRRLKTTSRNLKVNIIEDILTQYSKELIWGGFEEHWVRKTLESAIIGYSRMVKAEIEGTGWVNRPEKKGSTRR